MMKQITKYLSMAAITLFTATSVWAQVDFNLNELYQNGTKVTAKTVITESLGTLTFTDEDENFTILLTRNSGNQPGFYTSSGYFRFYSSDTVQLTAADGITITKVVVTPNGSSFSLSAMEGLNTSTKTWTGSASDITFTGSGTNKWDKLTITYSTGGASSAVATTTTISAAGITNTDVYTSTVAGALSAEVRDNTNAVINGATIIWSGNNDDVATISASTGVVTLVSAGTVTFTATYDGVANEYIGSSDSYEMTVTSTAPYVQPTEIEITPNYTFWGKTGQFSGSTYNQLSGSQDNVSLVWTRGSGSTYANSTAMRFYKDNTLTFTAPSNYEIKSIELSVTGTYNDLSFSPSGFDSESKTWTGSSKTVTMSRPSNASSYSSITKFTITIGLPSSDPAISADDVNITYNATNGSIDYSLENATGNVSASVSTGSDWLTLGTITSSSVAFTCSANPNTTSRTATVTLSFSGADDKVVTVTQAAAPVVYSTIPALFEAATTTEKDVIVTFSSWVVSGVSTNGKNVFVTDNNGNGFVLYFSSDQSSTFESGKVITGSAVSCSLVLYNGFAELKNVDTNDLSISDGGSVTTISNIALSSLSGVNTGALVHYENLAGTISDNKYYLSDGTTSLQVYNSLYADAAIDSNKHYTITGIYQQYNNTKEILPRSADDIEEVVSSEPSIDLAIYSVESTAAGKDGTINVTCNNMGNSPVLTIVFFEQDGTTPATYDWVDAEINNAGNVYYLIGENIEAARTAYFKVYCEASSVYSNLVTVSQAAPVIDYATLPFTFNGGRSDIENEDGLTHEGLGTDYSSDGDKNNKLKFDGTGDCLKLKINQAIPGTYTLAFNIKGNGFSGGTFNVQISDDGDTYTDLMVFTSLTGSTVSYKFDNLPETVRFIKWIYVEKSSGNVGLGNIKLNQPSDTEDETKKVTASRSDGRYWATFYCSGACYTLPEGAKAYTMDSEKNLYLLGNGSVIPANTAVIIIADEEGDAESISLTLTKTADTAVAISGSENILHGSSYDIAVSRTGGTPYVLGNKGTPKVLNFYKYVGTGSAPTIPANRAYYVK